MHVRVFIYIKCKVTLHSGWQWKLRCSEQACGHSGGRRGWDELGNTRAHTHTHQGFQDKLPGRAVVRIKSNISSKVLRKHSINIK